MSFRRSVALLSVSLICACSAALAAPARRDLPEALRPWVDWVLHGHETELCHTIPNAEGSRACAWPSRLRLDLDARSGRFEQDWLVHARSFVRLPGDSRVWPQEVLVNGQRAAVVASQAGDGPGLWLETGSWHIAGGFAWDSAPQSIDVPPQTGLVSLRVAGREIASPQREAEGRLWLQAGGGPVEAEGLTLAVHRRIIDGVPLVLATHLLLEVSGKGRELVLGPALPAGFIPLSLDTPLPARLESDGNLRLQVRPGSWIVAFEARHVGPVSALSMPAASGTWAPSEVWSFDARPDLRVVTVEGLPAIDPQQTAIPDDWRTLPTFRVLPGETMTIVEKRRGDAEPAPDQLVLERTLWLDFDGRGITAQDRLGGTLTRSWRLESREPWLLGRASVGGEDQLLTRRDSGAAPGLEIRQGQVDLLAVSRLESRRGRLPAVGWETDVSSLGATLNLPPGWRLLAAPGVDVAGGTWIAHWTLLDLFLALIVTIAAARLWGWAIGGLAFVTMGLTLTEPGAPQWIWLVVLALEAVRRLLHHERGRRVVELARLLVGSALLVVAVIFMLQQARDALHPQLENRYAYGGYVTLDSTSRIEMGEQELADPSGGMSRLKAAVSNAAPLEAQLAKQRRLHDPREIVQTGPGLPSWTWHQLRLQWNGPVEQGQQLRLVLAPPWLNLIAGFLRIFLLSGLILRAMLPRDFDFSRLLPRGAGPASAATLALTLLFLGSTRAQAEIPSPELLDQLRARLLEAPPCGADCAEALRLDLEASGSTLRLRLEGAAAAESALALPGGHEQWNPRQVLLDGRPAEGLLRTPDGVLWILLPTGVHQVSLEGPLPERDAVQLPLPERPKRVTARLVGWTLSGLQDGGVPDDTLLLSRVASSAHATGDKLAPRVLPAFVTITRRVDLGLTWSVETRVDRVGPALAPVMIRVPLLDGESITSADVRVEEGRAVVTLGPGSTGLAWRSTLAEAPTLVLRAPEVTEWTEIWQLDASASWHVETSGIPPVHPSAAEPFRVREWRPWPGEEVLLSVTRPEAVAGASLTLDSSRLELTPGLRATDATLALVVRSSRGGPHEILLPEGAELQSLSVNGLAQPVRQEGRTVTIGVTPGSQEVQLSWREPRGLVTSWRSAAVDLKAQNANASVQVSLPNRWVLWLAGPRLGPAVLFWSLLAVLVLLSIALAQLRPAPLRFASWLLLLVGLSQVSPWMGGVVIVWFLLLGWRRGYLPIRGALAFDLLQVFLVIWTIASLAILFVAIQQGLLGSPQMQVAGADSTATMLRWYADRTGGLLPEVSVVSAPLWAYRLAMLGWALWLAAALLDWLRWAWDCFTQGGAWRRIERKPNPAPVPPPVK